MPNSSNSLLLAHPRRFYAGGEWLEPSSGSVIDVISSSTEDVVATVTEAQQQEVAHAVAAARQAFDHGPWPRLSHAERATYLRVIANELLIRSDELAHIWSTESGIVHKVAQPWIKKSLSGQFNYYASLATTFPFEERRPSSSGLPGYLIREPVGVVGAIVAWNGPAGQIATKCAPALLAGCTVVLKVSPEAPCSGYIMAEVCEKVGLPAGVFNMVMADRIASEALVRDPRIDKITFTGSTAVGQKIASICGERMARSTMELGGKSPAIVLDDYDVASTAQTVAAGLGLLTGQVCHGLTRIIVSQARHDEMVDALSEAVSRMRVGDPFDPATDIGPLATARQRERVESYIAKGKAEGARLSVGGGRPRHMNRGFYVEPTVFGKVDNCSTIAREEIFGPVLSVIAARDEQQAIEIANDSIYGLNASVFTRDVDKAYAVARQLRSGTVGHNASRTDNSIAFGGFKQSGLGREGGTEGLLPFLETKTVILETPYTDSETAP